MLIRYAIVGGVCAADWYWNDCVNQMVLYKLDDIMLIRWYYAILAGVCAADWYWNGCVNQMIFFIY